MRIEIERSTSRKREGWLSCYDVPTELATDMTIMKLLEYICVHLDPTLSYYSHSVCDHGVCGRCLLRADGHLVLACTTKVGQRDVLHLAPADKSKVVRDLVVQRGSEGNEV